MVILAGPLLVALEDFCVVLALAHDTGGAKVAIFLRIVCDELARTFAHRGAVMKVGHTLPPTKALALHAACLTSASTWDEPLWRGCLRVNLWLRCFGTFMCDHGALHSGVTGFLLVVGDELASASARIDAGDEVVLACTLESLASGRAFLPLRGDRHELGLKALPVVVGFAFIGHQIVRHLLAVRNATRAMLFPMPTERMPLALEAVQRHAADLGHLDAMLLHRRERSLFRLALLDHLVLDQGLRLLGTPGGNVRVAVDERLFALAEHDDTCQATLYLLRFTQLGLLSGKNVLRWAHLVQMS